MPEYSRVAILKRSTTDALRAKNLLIGFELPLSVGGEPHDKVVGGLLYLPVVGGTIFSVHRRCLESMEISDELLWNMKRTCCAC